MKQIGVHWMLDGTVMHEVIDVPDGAKPSRKIYPADPDGTKRGYVRIGDDYWMYADVRHIYPIPDDEATP